MAQASRPAQRSGRRFAHFRRMRRPARCRLLQPRGRLAVDQAWRGRGLGADLLRDAVLRIVAASGTVGARAILVHAISEDAKTFYEKHGFRASPIEPMTLMITVEEARRLVGGPTG